MTSIISLRNIDFPATGIKLIDSVSFDIPLGKVTCVLGPSGSGKSILLKIMSGIIVPSSGNIIMDNIDIMTLNEDELKNIRRRISFVFQDGALLSNLSIRENLLLPVNFHFPDMTFTDKNNRINEFLKEYNIEHTLNKRPSEISSANRKIVAFIRALMTDPDVLIVDEPVANLDARSRKRILNDLLENKAKGKTIVLVTQALEVLNSMVDYVVVFGGGKVIGTGPKEDIMNNKNENIKNIVDDYMMSVV